MDHDIVAEMDAMGVEDTDKFKSLPNIVADENALPSNRTRNTGYAFSAPGVGMPAAEQCSVVVRLMLTLQQSIRSANPTRLHLCRNHDARE